MTAGSVRSRLKQDMDDLATALLASMEADPDDFDGREELWMQRENTRALLAELDQAKPIWSERVMAFLFGQKRGNVGLVGATMVILHHPFT